MNQLTYSTIPAFNRISRFSAYCAEWVVVDETTPFLLEMAKFRFELGQSLYKPSFVSFVRQAFVFLEYPNMPAKADAKSTSETSNFKGFINVPLTDEDKATISEKYAKAKHAEMLFQMVDVGKVTISFNPQNGTYNCSVIFYGGTCKGYCVSSFAPSANMAVYITWYKLDVYADNITPDVANQNRPLFG